MYVLYICVMIDFVNLTEKETAGVAPLKKYFFRTCIQQMQCHEKKNANNQTGGSELPPTLTV